MRAPNSGHQQLHCSQNAQHNQQVAQVPPKNTICTHQRVCGRSTCSDRALPLHTPREQVPPATPAPRQANPAHTETQDNPKNDEHVHAFLTHYRKPPLTVEGLVTCAAMSRRKVVRAVMQRRFASPNEAGACSITPTSPRTPPCTYTSHPSDHPIPTRLRAGSRPPPKSGFGRFPPWDNYKSQNPAIILPCTDSSPARRRIPPQEGTDT